MAKKAPTPRAWSYLISEGVLYVYQDAQWKRVVGERVNDYITISQLEQTIIQTRWRRHRTEQD